ncbi:hypothetical protein RO3G_03422 [Rhizopus delemar RA 99-880]|uniref:AB hydrolase-1 domain-containing protein n=1 Tax=Rhizopus delemar (strain RA 99-880 / ATCC MYA-4621 / FGSC 9543 / NRRL 43880) TaxID=246409 RepID=I1BR87_RHIO9|nr:hypothetical protein RO3G_03422 [Rhizopus delemar RA 99-880]|eukprot:EIE78717.1 hypothetical protein RO3G_03422 [Rhizopus delemar RA 99-880]
MRLIPTSSYIMPVHPGTEGWEIERLAAEQHEFPATGKSHKRAVFLFSHGIGFNKEAYHPFIKRFVDHLRSLREYDLIDIHVVISDARFHGESARLNQGKFSPTYRWIDNALDIKQVVDELKLKQNYDQLIAVGHSFGASSMILLQSFFPHTFDGLCLIEPALKNNFTPMEIRLKHPAEACLKSFSKGPFWSRFHPEALQNYVDYGTYDTDQGTIRLKCPKEHERRLYLSAFPEGFTAFNSARLLKVPVHYVFASLSSTLTSEIRESVVPLNSEWATSTIVEGTHMLPCEVPDMLVPEVMKLISRVNNMKESSKL